VGGYREKSSSKRISKQSLSTTARSQNQNLKPPQYADVDESEYMDSVTTPSENSFYSSVERSNSNSRRDNRIKKLKR